LGIDKVSGECAPRSIKLGIIANRRLNGDKSRETASSNPVENR